MAGDRRIHETREVSGAGEDHKLERQIRLLKTYALLMTLVCGTFMVTGFVVQNKNQKFEEIDVERINVVEKDGRLKLVISNAARQHPGAVDGKLIPRAQGIQFLDDKGRVVSALPEKSAIEKP
jgi:hypothetical protein